MSNNSIKIIITLFFLTLSTNALSAKFVSELSFHTGGDELAKATFANGDTKSINAGGGIQFAIGTKIELSNNTFIKALLGYNFHSESIPNGSAEWKYVPISIMYFKKTRQWLLGSGVTQHITPNLSGTGDISFLSIDYNDALGFVIEADYRSSSNGYIGLRYTMITYVSQFNNKVEGNSIGLVMGGFY